MKSLKVLSELIYYIYIIHIYLEASTPNCVKTPTSVTTVEEKVDTAFYYICEANFPTPVLTVEHQNTLTYIMATAMVSSSMRMGPYITRLVKGPRFRRNEEMQYEGVRLNTFKNWPNWAAVWLTVLARAGFYCTGTEDQVACFCCSGRLKSWEAGDSPLTEHRRFFPQCRFVTGQDSTNVPLGEASEVPSGGHCSRTNKKSDYYSQLASGAAAGRDQFCGPTSFGHTTPAVNRRLPQRGQYASLQYSVTNDTTLRAGLSIATGGGMYSLNLKQQQDLKLESKRVASFTNWPNTAYGCPANLAKAGLYYFDIADHVKCAFCNVTLRDMKPHDDPMQVHLKFSPHCAFLKDARAAGNVSIEEEKVNIQQASQVRSARIVIHKTIPLFLCLSVCMCFNQYVYLSVCISVCTSVCPPPL